MCDGRVRVRQAQCGQSTSMLHIEDTLDVRSFVDVQSALICAWAPPANAGDRNRSLAHRRLQCRCRCNGSIAPKLCEWMTLVGAIHTRSVIIYGRDTSYRSAKKCANFPPDFLTVWDRCFFTTEQKFYSRLSFLNDATKKRWQTPSKPRLPPNLARLLGPALISPSPGPFFYRLRFKKVGATIGH